MALHFQTDDPAGLLAEFRRLIDAGHIDTWQYDDAGDFTHTPDQWRFKAWMKPYVGPDVLSFGIIAKKSEPMKVPVYGVYHGRLMESFLNHCDQRFRNVVSTALLDPEYDIYSITVQTDQPALLTS
ncbi:MAG TPA: hypothetical protein VHC94_19225 [Nitrobacter sp.]|nr:hypothetical protein [Nitrobacter sp.]